MKDDKEAFIFTLKNFFGVEPTRYKKKKESEYAIFCCNNDGPTFGNGGSFRSAIATADKCNNENSCIINNDGTHGYECHHRYSRSLFTHTADLNKWNCFSVFDYEVYALY